MPWPSGDWTAGPHSSQSATNSRHTAAHCGAGTRRSYGGALGHCVRRAEGPELVGHVLLDAAQPLVLSHSVPPPDTGCRESPRGASQSVWMWPSPTCAILLDGLHRVHHVAQRLGHLAALLVAHLRPAAAAAGPGPMRHAGPTGQAAAASKRGGVPFRKWHCGESRASDFFVLPSALGHALRCSPRSRQARAAPIPGSQTRPPALLPAWPRSAPGRAGRLCGRAPCR